LLNPIPATDCATQTQCPLEAAWRPRGRHLNPHSPDDV